MLLVMVMPFFILEQGRRGSRKKDFGLTYLANILETFPLDSATALDRFLHHGLFDHHVRLGMDAQQGTKLGFLLGEQLQITGVVAPDSGQVVFAGRDVTRLSLPRRARAGLARSFQITSVVAGFSAHTKRSTRRADMQIPAQRACRQGCRANF